MAICINAFKTNSCILHLLDLSICCWRFYNPETVQSLTSVLLKKIACEKIFQIPQLKLIDFLSFRSQLMEIQESQIHYIFFVEWGHNLQLQSYKLLNERSSEAYIGRKIPPKFSQIEDYIQSPSFIWIPSAKFFILLFTLLVSLVFMAFVPL